MLARLYWPHVGGVEKHVEGLAAELIGRGYEVTLITEQYEKSLPVDAVRNGVRILRIPYSILKSKRKLWQWIIYQKQFFAEADLIHAHDVFWWYAPLRFLMPTKKIFTTFHGYEGSNQPTWKAVLHRKAVELLSAGTICIGGFMRKWYLAFPNKILYGAANIKPTAPSTNRKAVFLGRLDEDTGILMYTTALQLIKPTIKLDVFGDGQQKKAIDKKVRVRDWIKVSSKTFAPYRYAFVSRYLAILEAMQAKRLVVAVYNNRIKKDYLYSHPRADSMIIAGSAQELAEKMNALDKETEKSLMQSAYAWAKHQTWDMLAMEYLDLWNKK